MKIDDLENCYFIDVREEQKDTGKDACVVRQLLEEVLVVAWHKICIKEKSKIEENIKKHMEQTKTKIGKIIAINGGYIKLVVNFNFLSFDRPM